MGAALPLATQVQRLRSARKAIAEAVLVQLKRARQLTAKELADPAGRVVERGPAPPQGARGRRAGRVRAGAPRRRRARVRVPAEPGRRGASSPGATRRRSPPCSTRWSSATAARRRWRCSRSYFAGLARRLQGELAGRIPRRAAERARARALRGGVHGRGHAPAAAEAAR